MDSHDVEWGDKGLTAAGFTQIVAKPGGKAVLALFGKQKATAYHWLHGKGWRCDGDSCPACKTGHKAFWSAYSLALGYTSGTTGDIGYVALSKPAYVAVSALNGGKPLECDLRVDSGHGYEFYATPPRWTLVPELAAKVRGAAESEQYKNLLMSKLYRKLNAGEWESLLKHGSPDWEE